MSNKLKMINSKFKKRVCIFLWLIALISYVAWRPQLVFAVKAVPGVVPNPPPLFELDAGVKPNLSGNIQTSGRAVLPGEEGSVDVDVDKLESIRTDANQTQTQTQTQTSQRVATMPRGISYIWWLAILVIGFAIYFGYKRWRLMR